jgi:uncharacterized protein with ParB-like and HNH nuclease domain
MNIKIDARSKSVSELLDKVKYGVDYYQREYKWETKQIAELLEDLETKFLDSYEPEHERRHVADYTHYFLGSIVISNKNGQKFIIDGQQRLTSLTLLLIYLRNLQPERHDLPTLIFSDLFGEESFNLDVEERVSCIKAIYHGQPYDATGALESVRNIAARYADIQAQFPETLQGAALAHFTDWLIHNVDMVEITAYSDDEAYTIFETMNDRGLSLSPTDMLKGYLLANIEDGKQKEAANDLWKNRLRELGELGKGELGKEEGGDFFKAWLRAKYADSIRERKKGAHNRDFDIIGTTFHKWVREKRESIGLKKSEDFHDFVMRRFDRFARHYLRVRQAAEKLTPGFESLFYNAHNNMTLQYPLVLAPLRIEDDWGTAERKIRVVASYLDIFIARRAVNFRTLDYSSVVYSMFNLMKDIRDLDLAELVALLKVKLDEMPERFTGMSHFSLNLWSKRYIHYILARITQHIEEQCGVVSSFEAYVSRDMKKPFEIEHIWADKYERHTDEFASEQEFAQYRNRIGGLVLLPRGFNQSLNDDTYEKKVKAYFGQNLLAKSLNEQCYQNNPAFLAYIVESNLPFKPHSQFKKADLEARQELYWHICEEIWNPARLDKELIS